MKKILIPLLAVFMAGEVWAAQTAITQLSTVTSSRQDLRGQVNSKLATIESNRQDHEARIVSLEALVGDRPWVSQATAPADTTLLWFDTDQVADAVVLKIHTGGVWVAQDVGEGGTYTIPTASAETLGGIKVGDRLTITDGVLSADVQSGTGSGDMLTSDYNVAALDALKIAPDATGGFFLKSTFDALPSLTLLNASGDLPVTQADDTAVGVYLWLLNDTDGNGKLRKEIGWSIVPSGTEITVVDGVDGAAIPAEMTGMNIVSGTCSVYDLNSAASGETTVVFRRSRAGVDTDMLSTGITVSYDEYKSSDGVVDTSYDDIQEGDIIFVDINSITTAAQKGLYCTVVFE